MIFVRPFTSPREGKDPYQGATVSIVGTYGNWGYVWTHMGEDWRTFLTSISFDYAMGKFMGKDFKVDQPHEDSIREMKRAIIDDRRQGGSKETARKLWDALDPTYYEGRADERFFPIFDEASDGLAYQRGFWDWSFQCVNPAARFFWDKLWTQFADHLRAEIEGRTDGFGRLQPVAEETSA
jgi:hypothetical protein